MTIRPRPVELYMVPDIEHGSHSLQNPAQCLASQQGALGWFDFWLNAKTPTRPRPSNTSAGESCASCTKPA